MELRQIQHFMQLYKDCNMTRSSQNLYISQQGLSKSVSRLEEELGFRLFERTVSGVVPTEYAEKLCQYFRKVSDSFQELETEIERLRRERVLQILAPPGFALATDKKLFAEYGILYPEFKTNYVEVSKQEAIQRLMERKADVAFMIAPVPDELCSHQIVGRTPLHGVMARNHPLAQKECISLSDLENQELLLLDLYDEFNREILELANRQKISYAMRGIVEMNSFLPLIFSGNAIGFADREIYRYYDFHQEISLLPLILEDGSQLYVESHLVTLKGISPDRETQHYIDYEKEKWGSIFPMDQEKKEL